jgi:putative flippase GtrA
MPETQLRKNIHWSIYYFVGFIMLALTTIVATHIFYPSFISCNANTIEVATQAHHFWNDVISGNSLTIEWVNSQWMNSWQAMLRTGVSVPWDILYFITDESAIPTMLGIMILIKIGIAGFAFGIYIKRYSICNRIRATAAFGYSVVLALLTIWNPMVILNAGYLLPMLLHAMDKALRQKKFAPFAMVVAFSYFVSFPLANVLSVICIIYSILHLIRQNKHNEDNVVVIGCTILSYVAGLCAASIIILPTIVNRCTPSVQCVITQCMAGACVSAILVATHGWFKETVRYRVIATCIAGVLALSSLICGPLCLTEQTKTTDAPHIFISYNDVEEFIKNPDKYQGINDLPQGTVAYTLSGTEYLALPVNSNIDVPYGFVLYKTIQNDNDQPRYHIYKNTYALGVGQMYDSVMSQSDFAKLDVASQQLAMMKYAIIDDDSIYTVPHLSALELPVSFTAANNDLHITLDVPAGYELYLTIQDAPNTTLKYSIHTNGNGAREYSTKISNENNNVLIGSNLSGPARIKIHNSPISEKQCAIFAYSISEYITHVHNFKKHTWEPGATPIEGHLNTKTNGVFQVAIPYHSGWTAYVNHEPVDIIKLGNGYMGIQLKAGEYDVRFEYIMPGLGIGIILSLTCAMGIMTWLAIEMQEKIKKLFASPKTGPLVRFLITGCCTTATDFVLYNSLTVFNVLVPVAKGIASVCAACLSFFMNRRWSFRATKEGAGHQVGRFVCSQLLSIFANVCTNSLVLTLLHSKIIAFLCATFVSMCLNYTIQRLWVFRKYTEEN